MNILHICANPKPTEESVSKQLSVAFISTLVEKFADVELNNVDLYQDPPPFLDYAAYRGLWLPVFTPGYETTKEEKKAMAYAVRHAELFNQADVLILTMPMWNFSVPAILKAWIDQVIAPNLTFAFAPKEGGGFETQPLHHVRKLVLLAASGGAYQEGDPRDALTAEISAAFGFIGITDLTIAWADGQNAIVFGDHETRKQTAIEAAMEAAEEVAESAMAESAAAPA